MVNRAGACTLKQFMLNVWGDFACFTRPEFKVERFSYPVMTPSAARAVFDSIYISYDPGIPARAQFRWQVRRIEILRPVLYIDLTRNEVKNKASVLLVKQRMKQLAISTPNDKSEHAFLLEHTQRQTLALQNVRYRIHAEAVLYVETKSDRTRIECVFERRALRGQCMRQPYLGCREFPAFFELTEGQDDSPVVINEEIGWMPYDVFDLSQPNSSHAKASVSIFFAQIKDGVLEIPPYDNEDVRKLELSR
jgi:CRISPR-associated protein Cas5d